MMENVKRGLKRIGSLLAQAVGLGMPAVSFAEEVDEKQVVVDVVIPEVADEEKTEFDDDYGKEMSHS